MSSDEIQSAIIQAITNPKLKTVAIVAHDNPDADAIGSMVALEEILKQLGKKVTFIAQTKIKQKYKPLVGKKRTNKMLIPRDFFDILFVVDCSTKARIRLDIEEYSKMIIVIDHHLDFPEYGNIYWCENKIANTMLIYQLVFSLQRSGYSIDITSKMATAMYMGIVSDSYNFRSKSITSEVHQVSADLLKYDVDTEYVNSVDAIPRTIIPLESEVLKNVLYDSEYKIIYVNISKSLIDKMCATYEDASQIIDILRNYKNVDVAVVFVTNSKNVYIKVRSRTIDVSKLMKEYGGGGHRYAAGAVCYADSGFWLINSVIRRIKDEIDLQKSKETVVI